MAIRTDLKVSIKANLSDNSTLTQTKTIQGVNAASTNEQLETLGNSLSSFVKDTSALTGQKLVITDLYDESDD